MVAIGLETGQLRIKKLKTARQTSFIVMRQCFILSHRYMSNYLQRRIIVLTEVGSCLSSMTPRRIRH